MTNTEKGTVSFFAMGWVILFLFLCLEGSTLSTNDKKPFAVWDKTCYIIDVNSVALAPMIDGKPDYSKVKLTGLHLPSKCLHYELR